MSRKIVIEGALFFVMGCMGIVEGLRIGFQKDAQAIQGLVGPGAYLLFPSLLLMITGIVYFFRNFRNRQTPKRLDEKGGRKVLTLGIIMVLALYIALIDVCGYLLASVVFFLLEFRILGIQSWVKIFFLTGIIVAFNYIIFVEFFSMSLPRGLLFR